MKYTAIHGLLNKILYRGQLEITRTLLFVQYFIFFVLALLLKVHPQFRNIWIISERGDKAEDNGLHLFKYIIQNKNKNKIYYVIDKKSKDYTKIKQDYEQYLINKKSFKHWLFFCLSQVKISTHIMGYAPDSNYFYWIDKKYGLVFGKKVFLQHGIINNFTPYLAYPNVKLDLFVCGSKTECNFVRERFNHSQDIVQYLGLCRYDNLNDNQTEKVIVLMPTWRNWLRKCKSVVEFKETEYFKKYNEILTSEKLSNLLSQYDFTLQFYPHYLVQNFISAFNSQCECKRVTFANKNNYSIQDLLKKASILITDYSSVFWDFAYMKKPIVFYNFDVDRFFTEHYSYGNFDFRNNFLGMSCINVDEICDSLEKIIENRCKIKENTDNKINEMFLYRDDKNCERNYNAIFKLVKKLHY